MLLVCGTHFENHCPKITLRNSKHNGRGGPSVSRHSLPSAKPNLVLGLADYNSITPEDVGASCHLALDSVWKELILTDLTDAFQKL